MNIFNREKRTLIEKDKIKSSLNYANTNLLIEKFNKILEKGKNIEAPNYPIKPPELLRGVVPEGKKAPVLALDNACYTNNIFSSTALGLGGFVGFPGFNELAMLTTRPEYRQFADVNATELTREWIKITSSSSKNEKISNKIKAIEEKLIQLDVRNTIRLAAEQVDFYGRAQILIKIEGQDLSKPLILSGKTIPRNSIEKITAVEPFWSTPSYYNAVNPADKYFYNPPTWWVLGQEIHSTRLLNVITRGLPDIIKPAFNFAGISLSQLAFPYVDNWLRTRQAVADLLNNFSVIVLNTNLESILQGNMVESQGVLARADFFTKYRSNKGLMLLDKESEELTQIAVPLAGLSDLQAQAQEHLCTVSGIPAVKLLGVSPAGFNATADGEIRAFYDKKSAEQEAFWRAPIKKIIDVIMISEFGEIDPEIHFTFNPLWQMDKKEEAEIKESEARRNSIYINDGVFSQEEIRNKLANDIESGYDGISEGLEDEFNLLENEELEEMPQVESRE
jgi:phage-related protein (TIGR01555 family)